jgi:hypothetical protein
VLRKSSAATKTCCDLSDQLEPEDGKLWIHDIDGAEILAFSEFGIETLREIIADQIDRKR